MGTWLAGSGHRDHSKGRELLRSAQNHQRQLGLGARHPGVPCRVSLWVKSLPGCRRRKSVLPAVLPFKAATTSPSGASVPTAGDCSGQTGCQKTILSILLAERALGLAHQAHRHFRLLSVVRWWVPRQELCYF